MKFAIILTIIIKKYAFFKRRTGFYFEDQFRIRVKSIRIHNPGLSAIDCCTTAGLLILTCRCTMGECAGPPRVELPRLFCGLSPTTLQK